MTGQDKRPDGGKRPPLGSVIIVFLLKIAGGFLDLFHVKKKFSAGNMTAEEREVFSPVLDGMKQDLTEKDKKGE